MYIGLAQNRKFDMFSSTINAAPVTYPKVEVLEKLDCLNNIF